MIWLGDGIIELEQGEPVFRSCWKCNSAHEHLKTVNALHQCFLCGEAWVFDRFLESFESDEDFDAFFSDLGLSKGDSTTKIDKGYRIHIATVEVKRNEL